MSDELFAKMAQAIIDGEAEDAAALAQEGLDAGIAPGDILDKGFVKGIEEVGDLFAKGEFFLPEQPATSYPTVWAAQPLVRTPAGRC